MKKKKKHLFFCVPLQVREPSLCAPLSQSSGFKNPPSTHYYLYDMESTRVDVSRCASDPLVSACAHTRARASKGSAPLLLGDMRPADAATVSGAHFFFLFQTFISGEVLGTTFSTAVGAVRGDKGNFGHFFPLCCLFPRRLRKASRAQKGLKKTWGRFGIVVEFPNLSLCSGGLKATSSTRFMLCLDHAGVSREHISASPRALKRSLLRIKRVKAEFSYK